MRLRIFDWGTRWFWVVIFYKPHIYGEAYFTIEIFNPSKRMRWFHFWQWEPFPDKGGEEIINMAN